ncbi:MAG TPA: TIR domain-containing protein [Candidatus Kapabacteria bacterium]|nr:TIR domain-containing protein [Candidatus Kapabacteria bacterium]
MSDIFISYSSQDRAQAYQLIELLGSAGLSVWIDRSGIEAAASWSESIVDAIDACKAFIVMLSPASIVSPNVVKEVSLASEKRKKILPLDLEPVELSKSIQYALAGIQRSSMTNIDAIIRALGKLGLEATQAPSIKLVHETDERKSLMILPFEDLSPTADNAWFADGIAAELINALSPLKALRVSDHQATKDYKRYQGSLPNYAKEMNIRYFIEGQVRKFGDQIKITSSLLDIETGDHLWQDSMKGTMNDVFDIQEQVAEKVVEGLKVHLAQDEKKKLAKRGTENAEAYELYLKAYEYSSRSTREGHRLSIQQLTLAIELDPNYANALHLKAHSLAALYRSYDRDPNLLNEAEQLADRAFVVKPDLCSAYDTRSFVYLLQGRLSEAEAAANEYVRRAPQDSNSHFCLGFFYAGVNQPALALAPYEKSIELKQDDLTAYFNLVINSDKAHDTARVEKWSRLALPHFERRLRLVPDDENARVHYANLLRYAGYMERAVEALAPLLEKETLDGFSLYNIACLYASMNDTAHALEMLRRSVAAGFAGIEIFRMDPDLDGLREGPPTMRAEFQELMERMETA